MLVTININPFFLPFVVYIFCRSGWDSLRSSHTGGSRIRKGGSKDRGNRGNQGNRNNQDNQGNHSVMKFFWNFYLLRLAI